MYELAPSAVAALLDRECAGDAELRREVESLLKHHQAETIVLQNTAAAAPSQDRFPPGTVLAGLLFGAFRAGSVVMATDTSIPPEIVSIIEPVLVLFIAAPALIRGIFRLRAARRGGVGQLAKGWNG